VQGSEQSHLGLLPCHSTLRDKRAPSWTHIQIRIKPAVPFRGHFVSPVGPFSLVVCLICLFLDAHLAPSGDLFQSLRLRDSTRATSELPAIARGVRTLSPDPNCVQCSFVLCQETASSWSHLFCHSLVFFIWMVKPHAHCRC
jgi:hypothetical protein